MGYIRVKDGINHDGAMYYKIFNPDGQWIATMRVGQKGRPIRPYRTNNIDLMLRDEASFPPSQINPGSYVYDERVAKVSDNLNECLSLAQDHLIELDNRRYERGLREA